MISVSGGSPNVEQVAFGIESTLQDNNNVNEVFSHNDEGESGDIDNGNATISSLPHTATKDSDSNDNDNETENPDAAKSPAKACRVISKFNTASMW